jgi:hypothetical protein
MELREKYRKEIRVPGETLPRMMASVFRVNARKKLSGWK